MNLTAIIRLKEKIAISSEFTPKERDFILESINIAIDVTRGDIVMKRINDPFSKLPKLRKP